MSAHGVVAARATADVIRSRVAVPPPAAAIVLGSGLGALADSIGQALRIPYGELPGFHAPGVAGHRGELIVGTLRGRDIIAFAGRFHMYEGHSAQAAAFPVRVARALGTQVLVLSNAAGGINPRFAPAANNLAPPSCSTTPPA